MVKHAPWFAVALLFAGCSTTARFASQPGGALVFVDGDYIGQTPVKFRHRRALPGRWRVQMYKPGYEPLDFYIDPSMSWLFGSIPEGGSVVNAMLGVPVLAPLGILYLWAWGYGHNYEIALTAEVNE